MLQHRVSPYGPFFGPPKNASGASVDCQHNSTNRNYFNNIQIKLHELSNNCLRRDVGARFAQAIFALNSGIALTGLVFDDWRAVLICFVGVSKPFETFVNKCHPHVIIPLVSRSTFHHE